MSFGVRLILFTDGITEVRRAGTDDDGPEPIDFGEDQLVRLAVEHRACSAPALQARLAAEVASFAGGAFQDDATLIVLAVDASRDQRLDFRDEQPTYL